MWDVAAALVRPPQHLASSHLAHTHCFSLPGRFPHAGFCLTLHCPRLEPLRAPGGPRPHGPQPLAGPTWLGWQGPVALPGRSLPALRLPAGFGLEGDRAQEVCRGASPLPLPVWAPCVSSGGSSPPGRSLHPGACPLSPLLPTPRPGVRGSPQGLCSFLGTLTVVPELTSSNTGKD